MKEISLLNKLFKCEMEGYILGLDRSPFSDTKYRSHIYKGTFSNPEKPMCKKGWNRNNGKGFSIFRNNIGLGICKICLKNTRKELKINY